MRRTINSKSGNQPALGMDPTPHSRDRVHQEIAEPAQRQVEIPIARNNCRWAASPSADRPRGADNHHWTGYHAARSYILKLQGRGIIMRITRRHMSVPMAIVTAFATMGCEWLADPHGEAK